MEIKDRCFLPSKTRTVHAATIEFFKCHPVFAWFGGTKEGYPDSKIYIYNLENKGDQIVLENDNIPRWNPILFAHDDQLFLFEKMGTFCDRWQTIIHKLTHWYSWDELSQSKIKEQRVLLPAGLNGPVKTKPIKFCDLIFCGSSVETLLNWTSYIERYEYINGVFHFDSRTAPIKPELNDKTAFNFTTKTEELCLGIIQPSLFVKDGKIQAFFRSSRGLGSLYYSMSYDGEHWYNPIATNLPNPNSGIDTVVIDDRLFLAYNDSEIDRKPLVVSEIKVKYDHDWNPIVEVIDKITINETANDSEISDELSYPYMISRNGNIHLVYTYGRKKIEYCVIGV